MGPPNEPRGIEVLLKKAVVDREFRTLLLDQRGAAAASIGLALSPQEKEVLDKVPGHQLEGIIARTRVEPYLRQVLLGSTAAAMLLAMSASVLTGCKRRETTLGIKPDRVKPAQPPGDDAEGTKTTDEPK